MSGHTPTPEDESNVTDLADWQKSREPQWQSCNVCRSSWRMFPGYEMNTCPGCGTEQ